MSELSAVRDGLSRGEFFLEYLPTIALTDGRCIGGEALVRWRKDGHVLSPAEFIPRMENTPASGLITYWVIETVMAQLGRWLAENPDAHLSINAPPEILGRGGITYAADRSGLSALASQVILEITERGIPDVLAVESTKLRGTTRVALDDVTLVGGVNQAVLAGCQFDAIKLDKSMIDQIVEGAPPPEWLQTVKGLVESPSPLLVIAEGVDTEYQADRLREANIQAAQGFYYSRPLPADAFIAYHRERNRDHAVSTQGEGA
jgi:sensor c-di-GMP phosphodiesterase-like protein